MWGIVFAEGVTPYMLCQFCANPESVAEDKCGFNPPKPLHHVALSLAVVTSDVTSACVATESHDRSEAVSWGTDPVCMRPCVLHDVWMSDADSKLHLCFVSFSLANLCSFLTFCSVLFYWSISLTVAFGKQLYALYACVEGIFVWQRRQHVVAFLKFFLVSVLAQQTSHNY